MVFLLACGLYVYAYAKYRQMLSICIGLTSAYAFHMQMSGIGFFLAFSDEIRKKAEPDLSSWVAVFCAAPHMLWLTHLHITQHRGCVSGNAPGKPRFRPPRRRATLPVTARYGISRIRRRAVSGNCMTGI